jgi:hypothetical protein
MPHSRQNTTKLERGAASSALLHWTTDCIIIDLKSDSYENVTDRRRTSAKAPARMSRGLFSSP